MKLKELKKILNDLPEELDEAEVILQKDSEGNGYSPLYGIDENSLYIPDNTWSGYAYHKDWTADDACMTEEDWEEMKQDKKHQAIILWPTN